MNIEKPEIERVIYENALVRMEKFGVKSIMIPHLLEKREVIKKSLISYYESTEEFEKCKFVSEFFNKVEKEVRVSQVINALKSK
jgi:hypothetical protein